MIKFILAGCVLMSSGWGFFGHQRINRQAVFTLPPEMIGFYKTHIQYLEESAVNPDKRRYAIPEEAPRHYIDLDDYGDSAAYKLPFYWKQAVEMYGEDSLMAHGIVPWHIQRMYERLKVAFMVGDPVAILKMSTELGHYVGDAHVPLHTTANYNGQKTGQHGIHGFWESRMPELFSHDYDFMVGKAAYVENVQMAAWEMVRQSHLAVDSVLTFERELSTRKENEKYSFETRANQTVKVYAYGYSKDYHRLLDGMVERRMRASIRMVGSLWYSAWVDAGQPDIQRLITYQPGPQELQARKEELEKWKEANVHTRPHE